ncbi:MAG TPA: M48 family metalloprotease [Bryobacteraceae bacterium]|nr:M48 family metalloprotease [Bryobacteraceae bacterium]
MKKFVFATLLALPLAAADVNVSAADRILDRLVEREQQFLTSIRARTPLIETYIQETPAAVAADAHPSKDHYFLGRFRLGETVGYESLVERTDTPPPARHGLLPHSPKTQPMVFLPRGFAQMAVIDLHDFNRHTYRMEYVRREFLGEVRCVVFDIAPINRMQPGKFIGRLWADDRDFAIVRFNGTYVPQPPAKGAPPERFFHFDSWRVNVAPGEWAPAQIYIEEEPAPGEPASGLPRFKAQSRIWDYAGAKTNKLDELTNILIESQAPVKDQAAEKELSPLESQRSWERQAEENLIDRLERGGLIAPAGPVDEVLNTVVNNLIVAGNLNVDARVRVLLTTPLETFSIGHTIIISRGLIDVLPDEASLALMLADELAHIALGHATQTQFAFHNQTMLSDAELLQRFRFERSPVEMAEAAKKTIEIMKASPYQKMANAGLFLKALASHSQALPRLLQANLGNQVANADALARLAEFTAAAPALDEAKLEQIAALPLGSRVKLEPWTNRIELMKARPVSLLSPREKMPFEVSPFVLYLTRTAK